GSHTDCNRLLAAIACDLGAPPKARARNTAQQWQKRIYWEPLTVAALSPAQRQAVLSYNPLDRAVWEIWGAAGFDTASVCPRARRRRAGAVFAVGETVRPVFLIARWRRRNRLWRSAELSKTGLRTGFMKADRALYAGQLQLAAQYYRRGLEEEPRAPAIWLIYGSLLKLSGDLAGAEHACRQSLRYDAGNAAALLHPGHGLVEQNRMPEAADAYRQTLRLDPACEEARSGLRGLGLAEAGMAERVDKVA